MTKTSKFDEQTHWDHDPGGVRAGGAGWAPPGADFFIDRADPYWGRVLDKARQAYGDPSMHFDTDSVGQERRLVFGDGTAVPRDGSLAYRDAANDKTYLLNNDGTVSPLDSNGRVGQAVSPAGFRRTAQGNYAPIDSTGHQVAPLTTAPPATPNGYHDENGVLTPKNERGDFYVDDPATGKRTNFDAAGRPITDPSAPAPSGSPVPTDEQQSGRAADAVKKLHAEMQNRYSQISDAEGKLSEVLLTAHATTADGQQKLQAIQQKVVEAIDNPDLSLDTPAGEQAFLTFLRGQVAAIGDVVKSGTLSAEDQAKAVEALSNLYGSDAGSTPAPVEEPTAAAAAPAAAPMDDGLGPEEPMPDPTLSDLGPGGVGAPQAADPLSTLASALPAALGAFPPGGLAGLLLRPAAHRPRLPGRLAGLVPCFAGLGFGLAGRVAALFLQLRRGQDLARGGQLGRVPAQQVIGQVMVDQAGDPPDRLLRRGDADPGPLVPRAAQRLEHPLRAARRPLPGRGERVAPGQPRCYRDRDHARQGEPHAPRVPRVGQLPQPLPQRGGRGGIR